jgi:hypothetical protein
VSENRTPRRIFRSNRDEIVGGCRKLHNEELHNLYSSPNIVTAMKSRRINSSERVTPTGGKRNAYCILM